MSGITVCPLGSGSSGNAIFIHNEGFGMLVDAGLSARQIALRLSEIGFGMDELSAVLISHEHGDHVKGAGVLSRRYGLRIYATEKTITAMKGISSLGSIPQLRKFEQCHPFEIGPFGIMAEPTPHDAAEPSAFFIKVIGSNSTDAEINDISVATDIGHLPSRLKNSMKGSRLIVLESNYDEEMLMNNPRYPYSLKQQIMGPAGHLSNYLAAMNLKDMVTRTTEHVFLAHLSQHNNRPDLALAVAEKYLGPRNNGTPSVKAATYGGIGPIYRL